MMDASRDILSLAEFSAGYGKRRIVHELNGDLARAGEVTALVGPNGAGKSTLLRAVAGLMPATGGAHLAQTDLQTLSISARSQLTTYMPQSLPQRVTLTVLEGVIAALRVSPQRGGAGASLTVRDKAIATLELLDIADLAGASLDRLSGGQRQLASLAQALARDPRVLLLDEPTSALDLNYQFRVMRRVGEIARDRGMIVLVVLHDLNLACRWADRIVALRNGRILASGPVNEVITDTLLRDVYDVHASIAQTASGRPIVSVEDCVSVSRQPEQPEPPQANERRV